MELRQLQYFMSAAKCGSFTEAAKECCIVQSAMSQQIAALEKDLGVRLFWRTSRGLRLTPEGEALMKEGRRLLDQAEEMERAVRRAGKGYYYALRLGCHGNLLRHELPRALANLRRQYPLVRTLIRSDMHQTLLNELKEDRLDAMLAVRQPEFSGLDWANVHTLCRDEAYAMLPADHPLAARESLRESDLSGLPMMMFTGDDKKRYLWDMQERGLQTDIYCYTPSQNGLETLVAAGYGISFCLRSAIRSHEGVAYRRIEDRPSAEICFLWRKRKDDEPIRALLSLLLMETAE